LLIMGRVKIAHKTRRKEKKKIAKKGKRSRVSLAGRRELSVSSQPPKPERGKRQSGRAIRTGCGRGKLERAGQSVKKSKRSQQLL